MTHLRKRVAPKFLMKAKLDEFSCGVHAFLVAHVEDETRSSQAMRCAYCGKTARFVRVLELEW